MESQTVRCCLDSSRVPEAAGTSPIMTNLDFFLFPGFERHEIIESVEFAGVILIRHVDLYLISFGFGEVSITLWLCNKIFIKTASHCSHFTTTSPHAAAETFVLRRQNSREKSQPKKTES